ncbi:hypothetical protein MB02_08750 [Croceicoccus estronivorus]|uniref:tetratricopeptide repeat protein n=1 Tax=Croceicoccus estronivorus TaxID=1172626 RepID=UPI00082CB010|nr:hypothetical protein [Croceicoccus estronivorus]OCC23899.1 hypothetical protein MB02_08750 [Croceicoccus estronivorus]
MIAALLLPLLAQTSVPADADMAALLPQGPSRLQTCLHQAQNEPEMAIKTAGDWLSESRGDAKTFPYQCLGAALARQANWADAEAAFLQARNVLPESETIRRARLAAMAGNAALADGRYETALTDLDLAETGTVNSGDPALSGGIEVDRSRALVHLGRIEDAGRALAAARRENPDNAEAWLLSATLARRENQLADAQTYIEKAAELSPVNLEIGLEAGVIAMLSGHEDAARKSWQSVADADPASEEGQTARSYLAQLDKP